MKKLIHVLRLIFEPSGKNRPMDWQPKRFQVIYPDGQASVPMAYDVACGYQRLFGGKVERLKKV